MRRFNFTFLLAHLFAASSFKAFCAGIILCLSGSTFLAAQTPEEEAAEEKVPSFRDLIRSLDPMDVTGLDPDLASILSDYYRFNFTSKENWAKVESIRYEGELRLADGQSFRFTAFKKKPDYTKFVIYDKGKPIKVMSYDGIEAWSMAAGQLSDAANMSDAEQINFIRDSPIGGPLQYLQMQGKTIESKGLKVARGRRCFEFLITQPSGQQITSMIDATSFNEFQRTTINAVSGEHETTTNIGFKVVENVRIPVVSEMRVDGELRYSMEIDDVLFNKGVTTWMFSRGSAAEVSMLEVSAEQGSEMLYLPEGKFLGQPIQIPLAD